MKWLLLAGLIFLVFFTSRLFRARAAERLRQTEKAARDAVQQQLREKDIIDAQECRVCGLHVTTEAGRTCTRPACPFIAG